MSFQVVPTSAQEYVLIQITDTHLLEQPEHEFVGMNPEQSFHEVMTHIQQHYPQADAIIHTGDLAQAPRPKTYQRYLHFMQQLGIPFFHTPGNHDDEKYFPFHQENPQQPVSQKNYVLIIDEINRADLARVLGEAAASAGIERPARSAAQTPSGTPMPRASSRARAPFTSEIGRPAASSWFTV